MNLPSNSLQGLIPGSLPLGLIFLQVAQCQVHLHILSLVRAGAAELPRPRRNAEDNMDPSLLPAQVRQKRRKSLGEIKHFPVAVELVISHLKRF